MNPIIIIIAIIVTIYLYWSSGQPIITIIITTWEESQICRHYPSTKISSCNFSFKEKKGFEKYEFSWFLEKNQIATFGLLTKHIGFFQKQKFMGLLYSEQEENIYINAVSSFPKIHALLQFLFQLLFDFWD